MNWSKILYVCLGVFLFCACYEEDSLTGTDEEEEFLRYEFPQGDHSWDKDIENIQDEFGVYLIYRGFKKADFNRSWTGSGFLSVEMEGEDLTDEQAEFSANFMKNHIFAYLTPKIVSKVLPMYWYMIYDYHNSISLPIPGFEMILKVAHPFSYDGLDFWGVCLFYGDPCPLTGERVKTPETPEEFAIRRGEILGFIMGKAYEKGNFEIPADFHNGLDYKTEITSKYGDEDKENFYVRRGFVGKMGPRFDSYSGLEKISDAIPDRVFLEHINFAIRYTDEEYESMWPSASYPLVHEKRNYVIKYMKDKYNIDLRAIARGPENE